MLSCSNRPRAAVLVCLSALVVSQAQAGFTTINPATPPEKSIDEILGHLYGGTFQSQGVDYSNGSITAVRIHDTTDAVGRPHPDALNLVYDPEIFPPGQTEGADPTTDQLWTADAVSAVARAKYASFNQEFGYVEGVSGGLYQTLIPVTGSGFNVQGVAELDRMSGRLWRWARSGENGTFTSQNSDNPGGFDHMVTYRIDFGTPDGGSGKTTYLLCFEDLKPIQNPDDDFNDLVIEIQASNAPIPEPASAVGLLALAGMSGMRGFGRRRRRPQAAQRV